MKYLIETKKCTALLMLLDVMAFSIDTDFNICFFLKLLQLELINFKLQLLLKLLALFFVHFYYFLFPSISRHINANLVIVSFHKCHCGKARKCINISASNLQLLVTKTLYGYPQKLVAGT